jgi:outer membrane receptor protein involved in Fe transport
VHYRGAYHDPESGFRIDAWTTTDAQLRYDTGHATVTFALQNVFDEMPAFWNNPLGVGFDFANGDLIGRYGSLEIRRRW